MVRATGRPAALRQRWPSAASEDRNVADSQLNVRAGLQRWPSAASEDRNRVNHDRTRASGTQRWPSAASEDRNVRQMKRNAR